MVQEKEVEREEGVTDGGHNYIKIEDLIIRDSILGRRLKEDGETFDEYKVRQKMSAQHLKNKRSGQLFWDSSRGTYVEAEVKAYIRSLLERKKKELETEAKLKEENG